MRTLPLGDRVSTGFGADRVQAGSGPDSVNAAVAGRRARVRCGGGRDTIRFNRNEHGRIAGCEKRFTIR